MTSSRRKAVYVSKIDEERIRQGLTPSWDESVSEADTELDSNEPCIDTDTNDERLQSDVPPHW